MKKTTFVLLVVLLFISCDQSQNSFSIAEQSELMGKDSIVIEHFEAKAASLKVLRESMIDMEEYLAIIKTQKDGFCEIKKNVFNGNIEMENLNRANCRMQIATQKFYNKYPHIRGMSKEERLELFAPLRKKPNLDMEVLKKNAEKRIENQHN